MTERAQLIKQLKNYREGYHLSYDASRYMDGLIAELEIEEYNEESES